MSQHPAIFVVIRHLQLNTCHPTVRVAHVLFSTTPANALPRRILHNNKDSPSSRRRASLCFQCVPGADASCVKHLDEKCQRDTVAHIPAVTNILLRNTSCCVRNTRIIRITKKSSRNSDRCLRSFNLPDFAKQIELSFHSNCSSHSLITSPKDSIADKGVYLLQTITVIGRQQTDRILRQWL